MNYHDPKLAERRILELEVQVEMLTEQLTQAHQALNGFQDDGGWHRFGGRLTRQQEELARLLHKRQGVVPKEAMYSVMYASRPASDWPDPKIVDVIICKVRQKLPPGSVTTVWGRGWMLTDQGRAWIDEVLAGKRKP